MHYNPKAKARSAAAFKLPGEIAPLYAIRKHLGGGGRQGAPEKGSHFKRYSLVKLNLPSPLELDGSDQKGAILSYLYWLSEVFQDHYCTVLFLKL